MSLNASNNNFVLNYICELVSIEKESRKYAKDKRKCPEKRDFEKKYQSYKGNVGGENYMFTGVKYLLNQIIRQYIPSDENFHISEDGYKLWRSLSKESVWGYVYTNHIVYDGTEDIELGKYIGRSKKPESTVLHPGEKFTFNDFYTDEHMIDVASIIEVMVRLDDITPLNIKHILDQIHIARILKSEDKILKPNHKRLKGIGYESMDIQYIYDNTYKNINLLSKCETM